MTTLLYDNIVGVMQNYLGPASQRFVDRHITAHLDKSPQEVTVEDLDQLTLWIRVSLALLTDNPATVDECTSRLEDLA